MSVKVARQVKMTSWKMALKSSCLAMAAAAVVLPFGASGQDSGPAASGATFYTGPNFTGQSKTLTLAADQPYQAIPFVGDELNEKIASLKVDPQLGVILFQRPYFASRDDACGPNLGSRDNPKAWWLGLTADFEPRTALPADQPYETGEVQSNDYSSVIAYRRDLGPPPGFLLLERRSYYNRGCERSEDQSYFNRLFVPVPNPPKREACTDLTLPASSYGAGADAPKFTRLSEAVALQPGNFSERYQGIDHRFTATVFSGPGCTGPSITLTSSDDGRPARHKLKDFNFDRRAKSVLIRYQRGPLDPYLESPSVASAVPAAPAAAAPAPGSTFTSQGQTAPAAATPAPAAPSSQGLQPQAPAPVTSPPAQAGGGLQPAPPGAPAQQQQALQPSPQVQPVPVQPAVTAPQRVPSGPQEETFRFPVHQVYRLNFCLDNDQGCGDPAARTWCQNKGFSSAARWSQEENIGALYPTVFIGSGTICDKFLCDGFEEITCTR
ncbi:hypothetical protein HBA54_00635 [Pelagibius litoralis]|uniref:Uncharacterized protein n=1 Tax=Pelagibius litoralis TaxID=374515 RepID=A0A967C5V5_9PROT|nr:hypothetical protein [Pelagibius litoralis]NIA67092.1 hypothetical protein [Pelagibius litoralis]